ncbi:NrfD/PsrC family molybdoenzyme membrane anchor subunit [Saccharopolyspora sp. CA-218241]|uniref:NrfD/PsrC family molybdoenzyme membrane anchor subunit n=1 Tax=Saccharopolyspora sp. CA-218241 TaxID=3240027 RepID=UPI003D97E86B
MSRSEVTRRGLRGTRPDREAITGGKRGGRRRTGEQPVVPGAEFTSYYGQPVLNSPTWESPDIPGYLFLGGLAGASSLLAAGADLTARPALSVITKCGAVTGGALSIAALVHDLGRPARFLNMLRVFKTTSPMSVGSWLLAGYVPCAGVAAASAVTGRARPTGAAATAAAALAGPAVATYTAALLSDTAVPAWHDGHPEMPFVFAGSAAAAAGGLGLTAPPEQAAPARVLAGFGVACELAALERMKRRIGMVAEPYSSGRAARYLRASALLSLTGMAGAFAGRRNRLASALSGTALLVASAATRWGVFHAGLASADDPKYVVVPQRERVRRRAQEDPGCCAAPDDDRPR